MKVFKYLKHVAMRLYFAFLAEYVLDKAQIKHGVDVLFDEMADLARQTETPVDDAVIAQCRSLVELGKLDELLHARLSELIRKRYGI